MKIDKNVRRIRRKKSIKNRMASNANRPRLTIYKSSKHIYAQIIDDLEGHTICSASTVDTVIEKKGLTFCNKEYAKKVGELLAKRALEKNIKEIVFDRNGYPYHGKVKELADAARKGGLEF